ncbi:hypothetical protein BLNAU_20341 [Blattamonas nauphoetae]|uniref:Uncharacterized protein n=1 Tax=Blattamonas nauphoetae TaxID=2049346 RepID=A0ABQ9X383_9EUKA|nr:hypothetical protein BLNAU_20341 [Blattamonas nauphoetae]
MPNPHFWQTVRPLPAASVIGKKESTTGPGKNFSNATTDHSPQCLFNQSLELLPPNEGNHETAESGLIETSPKIPTSSEPNTVEEQPVNPFTIDTNVDCPADIQQTSAQLVDPVPPIVQSFSENKPAPAQVTLLQSNNLSHCQSQYILLQL